MRVARVQEITVRLLHDPQLAAAVGVDPVAALAPEGLSTEEIGWIAAVDARAWRADPLRPRRVLKALAEEFPVSSALAVGLSRSVATLDRFFASAPFVDCVRNRGSLAQAFESYLTSMTRDPRIAATARIEGALARARRSAWAPLSKPGVWNRRDSYQLCSGLVPLLLPAGTVQVMQSVQQVLFECSLVPALALAHDGPSLERVPAVGTQQSEAWIVEMTGPDAAGLAESTEALVRLLSEVRTPVTGEALCALACELGADPAESESIVSDLIRDGTLRRAVGT